MEIVYIAHNLPTLEILSLPRFPKVHHLLKSVSGDSYIAWQILSKRTILTLYNSVNAEYYRSWYLIRDNQIIWEIITVRCIPFASDHPLEAEKRLFAKCVLFSFYVVVRVFVVCLCLVYLPCCFVFGWNKVIYDKKLKSWI